VVASSRTYTEEAAAAYPGEKGKQNGCHRSFGSYLSMEKER
jgi:hypothetical protein